MSTRITWSGLPTVIGLVLILIATTMNPAVAAKPKPIGKPAVVKGVFVEPFTVRVRVMDNDRLRVCIRGTSALPIAIGQWRTPKRKGGRRLHSQYSGAGCKSFQQSFKSGVTVRYRACFADPRKPKKIYCGKWRRAKAA